nr:autotransporter domain-containing SGNH/GDSL hydrolase family protein [uncultured Pseudomonas sp.]
MKPSLKLLTAAVMMAGLSTAQAMPYSQFIVFGDSLSDSGQFPDLGSPLAGGFPTGGARFTNRTGPTYQHDNSEYYAEVSPQRLASLLGLQALPSTPSLPQALTGNAPGTNYAVAGYETANILSSVTTVSVNPINIFGPTPLTRNGYLIDVPRVDPNALFYINGGGNDVRDGVIVDQTTAATSAGNLVAAVAALQAAGARTIIVSDLPDVGMTPESTMLGLTATRSTASALFNQELASQLTALGGNVIRLNLRGLLAEVQGDLASFGFDDSIVQTAVCFDGAPIAGVSCNADPTWGIGSLTADPSKLLFNDGIHPSAATHQITADYIYSILAAPWEVSLLPEMALASLNGHQQQLRSEWQADRGQWQAVGQWNSFVSASGMRQEFQRGEAVSEGDSDGLGVTLGGSYRLDPNWRMGLALGLQKQQLDSESDSQYDLGSYLLTAFAQYQQNRLWADASFTLGMLDYSDLDRQFALGITQRTESGDTDGQLYALSGRIGYDLANEDTGWRVSPFISADLARIDVDGYREQGNRSTALEFGDQQRDSRRLGVGMQVNYQLTPQTQLFAEVAREREFEDDASQLDMNLNSVSGDHFELQGHTPANGQTTALIGISQVLGGQLKLVGSYHFRGTEDRQHGINVGLSLDW